MDFVKKEWKSGTVTEKPYIVIDGVKYELVPAKVEGGTPITPDELNRIEQGIADALNLVVNSTTVTDKTEQTYSANIIDGLIEITKVTNFIQANSGYTVLSSVVMKDRNRYFGNVVVKKDSGYFTTGSEQIFSFKKKVNEGINSGCLFSDNQWNTKAIGYLYIGSTIVQVASPVADKYNFVKIDFDVVTTN